MKLYGHISLFPRPPGNEDNMHEAELNHIHNDTLSMRLATMHWTSSMSISVSPKNCKDLSNAFSGSWWVPKRRYLTEEGRGKGWLVIVVVVITVSSEALKQNI